jgi:putative flippase GtrA
MSERDLTAAAMVKYDAICLVIPALNPGEGLVDLVGQLRDLGFAHTLIVNDGSAPDRQYIFDRSCALGATVMTQPKNMGKGAALKAAFHEIARSGRFRYAITLDADGQHLPADVAALADGTSTRAEVAVFLGVRRFEQSVPLRSKFGNNLTQWVFGLVSGRKISDTQTGLRALPVEFLPEIIRLSGEKYEFEMNVLAHLVRSSIPIVEIPINTVYIDDNKSSHFRPVADSIRIYAVLLRDVFFALSSFGLDIALFTLLAPLSGSIVMATFCARFFSATYNFIGNRFFVFSGPQRYGLGRQIAGYVALAALFASVSGFFVNSLVVGQGMNPTMAKMMVDFSLYVCSFLIRRFFIFRLRR